MRYLMFITMILSAHLTLVGQDKAIQPGSRDFTAKYADFDFKGKFAVLIDNDETNNYYLLDFTKLPTRFERVYFMNLSFRSVEIVNIDPDITGSRVCFMSNRKYSASETIKLFEELKRTVNIPATSWSDTRKTEWLKVNDKYK